MKIAVLIVRILVGLVFVVFGSNGFLFFMPAMLPAGPAGQFLGLLMSSHYVQFVCVFMVIGGLLLLINRYVALGLALLGPVLVNILIFHLTLNLSDIGMGAVLSLLWLFLFWYYWPAFAPLFEARASAKS